MLQLFVQSGATLRAHDQQSKMLEPTPDLAAYSACRCSNLSVEGTCCNISTHVQKLSIGHLIQTFNFVQSVVADIAKARKENLLRKMIAGSRLSWRFPEIFCLRRWPGFMTIVHTQKETLVNIFSPTLSWIRAILSRSGSACTVQDMSYLSLQYSSRCWNCQNSVIMYFGRDFACSSMLFTNLCYSIICGLTL